MYDPHRKHNRHNTAGIDISYGKACPCSVVRAETVGCCECDFENAEIFDLYMMMPNYLGQPLYPSGCPIKIENIGINGESLATKFLRYCDEKHSQEDENILKDYVIYHINAPIFDSDFTQELRDKDLKSMSLQDMIMECLDYALDPF